MSSLVTIFGGSGFLGRYAVRALAKAGYRIRVAVRQPSRAGFLLTDGEVGQIQLVKANIRDPKSVAEAVRRSAAVINLVGVDRQRGRQRFEALHAKASQSVGSLAMVGGAEIFVAVSTLGASFEAPTRYARSKGRGEIRTRDVFPAATIFRPAPVFGAEDRLFNLIAAAARSAPFLGLARDGATKLQPVFVGDVAAAICKAVSDPGNMRGRTFELAGPAVYTVRELAELVLKETGRSRRLLSVPRGLSRLEASVPQLHRLGGDAVMTKGALGFEDLAIQPNSVEAVAPAYLWRYRRAGQFAEPALADAPID